MKLYTIHKSHRGGFIIPVASSNRLVFHTRNHEITKGSGALLLSKDLGNTTSNITGLGVEPTQRTRKMVGLQKSLTHVIIPKPIKKKKFISF